MPFGSKKTPKDYGCPDRPPYCKAYITQMDRCKTYKNKDKRLHCEMEARGAYRRATGKTIHPTRIYYLTK